MATPSVRAVAEPTTRHPWHSCRRRILVQPCLSTHRLEEHDSRGSANVSALRQQLSDLVGKPVRRVPVVIVPMCDHFPAGKAASLVAFCAQREASIRVHVTDAWVSWNEVRHGLISVVEDQQFSLPIVLTLKPRDRTAENVSPIARWHDARNERLRRRLGSPSFLPRAAG